MNIKRIKMLIALMIFLLVFLRIINLLLKKPKKKL